jgi:mono/diheme cytochrome c family protein
MAKRDEKDVVLDHDYDGIRELDNDLPPWWLYLFYVTIIWGILYLIYFHIIDIGDSSYAEYMKEMDPEWVEVKTATALEFGYKSPFYSENGDVTPLARQEADRIRALDTRDQQAADGSLVDMSFEQLILAAMNVAKPEELNKLQLNFPEIWEKYNARTSVSDQQQTVLATTEKAVPEFVIEPLIDEASLAAGKQIFISNCATCHGQQGGGGIGPNLTDDYYLHGAGMGNTVKIIMHGIPAKGMISWRGILQETQINQVASYILTMHGTNPPNARAPQGEKVELTKTN